jgi:archaellum component FlaG (FlaF/FlaG flagellin family)
VVSNQGVLVEILSGPASLPPAASGTWQVRVANTGASAETYNLSAFGVFSPSALFTPASVSLNAGQAQTVQLSAGPLDLSLPQVHLLGVLAQSQADPLVRSQDTAEVSISTVQAAQLAWQPASQTVSGALSAAFTLVISNTGNVNTTFSLSGSASPSADVLPQFDRVEIPARSTAHLAVDVLVPRGGVYQLSAAVQGGAAQASANAQLTVIYTAEPPKMFLPLVLQSAGVQVRTQRGNQGMR